MTENKLICPFCQQELKMCGDEWHDLDFYCDKCEPFRVGNRELWQELDRWKQSAEDHQQWLRIAEKRLTITRKALDYAITMLERIAVSPETMLEPEKIIPQLAAQALEQITALEQKDVK